MISLRTTLIAGLAAVVGACDANRARDDAPAGEVGEEPAVEEQYQEEAGEQGMEARELLSDASSTLRQMQTESELWQLAQEAQGIFIVPHFGRAAVGVGGEGGQGVLLARSNGSWSGPAFYDLGGVSVGAQLGASGGEIAMILMTPAALESFRQENDFSLDVDAGLTIVDYSVMAEATAGRGDVVLWSDMEGAFAGASLGATDIDFDEEENRAYYGQEVRPAQILEGQVDAPGPNPLRDVLSGSGR